ncbi:MAG: ribonuclease P protein component [Caldimonas sp.]
MLRAAPVRAIGRLVRATDFEQVLRARSRASTPHFAVHHIAQPPSPLGKCAPGSRAGKLSTDSVEKSGWPVDDSAVVAGSAAYLGAIVPKRHARRAVTRSLLKRQIYAAAGRHAEALASGCWIVRLRAPFDRGQFPSAASPAMRRVARVELDDLFATVERSPSR